MNYRYNDEKEKNVNIPRLIVGIFAVVLMASSIFMGIIAMNNVYQIEWRNKFANQHLDLAQASSNGETQYTEVSQAISIYSTFPKQGNWDYWNKLNPKTNMVNVWTALNEMQTYANTSASLTITDPAYQIAVYNTQEKVQYFQDNYGDAFDSYITWGAGGWVAGLGIAMAVASAILLFSVGFWAMMDESQAFIGWLLVFIPLIIAGIFFAWVGISPVYYTGPI
jgi:hypothetical protein